MPASQDQTAVTVRMFTQRFSATRRGARLARRLATQQLDAWGFPYGSAISDSTALIVAELAANAVLHGNVPGRDFALRLVHDVGAPHLRIEVSDTHEARPPTGTPAPPAPDATGGWGLALVAALAARWGVSERRGPGKTIWAEVARAGGADGWG